MYRAFKVDFTGIGDDSARKRGEQLAKENDSRVRKSLDSFVVAGGKLDGGSIMQHWFPTIKAEVFISHARTDSDEALRCAGWLDLKFGLSSFIDSSVWGYSIDLLKQIDDEHCFNEGKETYSYNLRNRSTAHVHMMPTALAKMLDRTECIFFLDTKNSTFISPETTIKKTSSPWLFYELAMMNLIRRRSKEEHREEFGAISESTMTKKADTGLEVEYPAEVEDLEKLDSSDLWLWRILRCSFKNAHALDLLYELLPGTKS